MTVLRPSFPPVISRTTRIGSLPGSAARAVRSMNPGTSGAVAIREERFKNSRRLSMGPLLKAGLTTEAQRHREDKKDSS
jgi:hypothetical protein